MTAHSGVAYNLRATFLNPGLSGMDKITEALLAEFVSEFGLNKLEEHTRFEAFAAWVTTRRHYSETTFDPTSLVTGSGNDIGIDGIAVIVNNNLVTDEATIDELLEVNGYLDVTFIFIQAERSSHFDMAKIGQFGFGVSDFFGAGKLPRNEIVTVFAKIMEAIYNHSSKFRPHNPDCILYYVTTGKWNNEQALVTRYEAEVESLKNTGLFNRVEFSSIGAEQVQKLYRQSKNAIQREFVFDKRVVVPEISGVAQAYLGFLTARDFLKIVCDDDGFIIKTLFYENIRDWIGYNQINTEIRDTLEKPVKDRFVLMNNGVTVIARMLQPTGDKFLIGDFQVVNGCQTSHVLHDNQALLTDAVRIPFRLISTQDEAVIESIIRATNRQTEVRDEQFFAMKEFAKKLEEHFRAYPVGRRLYYERRPHQYDDQSIEKYRVVSHPNLVRAFGAMILGEPHITTRNFSQLSRRVGKEIFLDTDKCDPYYLAGVALSRVEELFKYKVSDANWKPARYQMLLALRLRMNDSPLPRLNSNEIVRRCEAMTSIIWDDDQFIEMLGDAQAAILKIIKEKMGGAWHRDVVRTEAVTKAIFEHFGRKYRGGSDAQTGA